MNELFINYKTISNKVIVRRRHLIYDFGKNLRHFGFLPNSKYRTENSWFYSTAPAPLKFRNFESKAMRDLKSLRSLENTELK